MKKYISKSVKKTQKIAAQFAKKLKGGDVVSLSGNLGGGKTIFTQGLAKSLGVTENLTSPTFVILKEYKTLENEFSGKTKKPFDLVHIDLYRIEKFEDARSAGVSDYLGNSKKVCIIEWGEKIEDHLPEGTKNINFKFIDKNTREIKGDL